MILKVVFTLLWFFKKNNRVSSPPTTVSLKLMESAGEPAGKSWPVKFSLCKVTFGGIDVPEQVSTVRQSPGVRKVYWSREYVPDARAEYDTVIAISLCVGTTPVLGDI
mmetsp:Transcript_11780/g.17841  ORF Transcript_11780/g.17841 Transcript_11780/m.17841 type:complete len:108 (-) Transcript_11780:231-554(-)